MNHPEVDGGDRVEAGLRMTMAVLGTAAFAALGDRDLAVGGHPILSVAWVWPMLVGLAAAGISLAYCWVQERRDHGVLWAACWVFLGSWGGWSYHQHGGWGAGWGALTLGGLVLVLVAALFFALPDLEARRGRARAALDPVTRLALMAAEPPPKTEQAVQAQGLLARVTKIKNLEVTSVADWPDGGGHDIVSSLPGNGEDYTTVQKMGPALATALRLPRGCGVEVVPGDDRGEVVWRVSTVDQMREPRNYLWAPDGKRFLTREVTPLTINGPLPFGFHRDGTLAGAELRFRSALFVGETGSGKTNAQENINHGLVRCPDVVLCMIDLNGGGMPLQWLLPWLEGQATRPAVQWPAGDIPEALRITDWAIQVMQNRKKSASDLMRKHNVRVVPISPDMPAIVIVVDEGKSAMNAPGGVQLARNIELLLDQGRAVGIRVVFSGLRAVASVLSSDAKTQMGLRVGMQVADEAEIFHLFGWSAKVDLRDAPYTGCGFWRDGTNGLLRPFRSFHADPPDMILRTCAAAASWRPDPDPAALAVPAARFWHDRWDRVIPQLTGDDGTAGVPSSRPDPGPVPPQRDSVRLSEHVSTPPVPVVPSAAPLLHGVDEALAAVERSLAAAQVVVAGPAQEGPDELDREWEIISSLYAEAPPEGRHSAGSGSGGVALAPEPRSQDRRRAFLLRALLDLVSEGAAGVPTKTAVGSLRDRYPGLDSNRLAAMLREVEVEPRQFRVPGEDNAARGYRLDDLQAALAALESPEGGLSHP